MRARLADWLSVLRPDTSWEGWRRLIFRSAAAVALIAVMAVLSDWTTRSLDRGGLERLVASNGAVPVAPKRPANLPR
jgi:hypothetical protein